LPELFSKVEAVLMRWHAIDETAFGSRGAYADGRHLAIYESVMDTPFAQWSGPNPRPYADDQIESEYKLYLRNVTTKMLAQTALGQQLLPELKFENGNFLKLDDATTSATVLQRFVAAAPVTNLFDKLAYWHVAVKLLDTIYESFADVKGVAGGMALYASSVEAGESGEAFHAAMRLTRKSSSQAAVLRRSRMESFPGALR
jgi:hypothetical protein